MIGDQSRGLGLSIHATETWRYSLTAQTKETITSKPEEEPDETKLNEGALRQLGYFKTVLCAAAIGTAGGLVASVYYYVLEEFMETVWHVGPDLLMPYFPNWLPSWNYLWIVTTIGGFFVGLILYLMGSPGEMALVVDSVHDPGKIDIKQTPAMVVASLVSITAGGSAGPEAPLVQINGSLGGWLGDKLGLDLSSVRVLTFCGMSAALAAFFGDPIGGPLFALEIPHRRGLQYYEALIPAIVSGIFSFAIFKANTGLIIGGIYHFDPPPALTLMNLLEGVSLGAVGALAGAIFIVMFQKTGKLLAAIEESVILRATLGGLGIGLIASLFPETLFFSEKQIEGVIELGRVSSVTTLVAIAFAKMLAISFTLHCGFRGGFIFPLFFIGANLGLAVGLACPVVHPTLAMICTMAAVNVAVTKTPISTTVILSVLSSTALIPIVAIASFVSFFLTSNLFLLKTQRSRTLPISQLHPVEVDS